MSFLRAKIRKNDMHVIIFVLWGMGMAVELEARQKIIDEYQQAVKPLMTFMPWLEQHSGKESYTVYGGEGIKEHSLSFPVYDGTLMNFVRQAAKTSLMDRNYRYVYTRNHLRNHEDERKAIQNATQKEWGILKGILSNYVMGGQVKGVLWSEAVREDIFYLVLLQMKKIVDQWGPYADNE